MEYKSFLSADELIPHLEDPNLVIIDCRHYLEAPEQGFREYQEAHIPGAMYANLDLDLANKIIPGVTGRHPLPDIKAFSEKLSSWGIDEQTQVVSYDHKGGAYAARLWWMLRWLGHEKAAVLDGGWGAWVKNGVLSSGEEGPRSNKKFKPNVNSKMVVDADFISQIITDPDYLVIDSRSSDRYWGLNETVDPKAGHIPGAISAPYTENLTEEDYFLPEAQLRSRFENLLGGTPPDFAVFYCGSGVTAAHNLLVMARLSYDMPKLYVGSWSDWITDPNRPRVP